MNIFGYFNLKRDKPLIFSNNENSQEIKKNKNEIEELINENEDITYQIKNYKYILVIYKNHLSDVTKIDKLNQTITPGTIDEIIKLMKKEKEIYFTIITNFENKSLVFKKQIDEILKKFESINENSELNVKNDFMFVLRNFYTSKESLIMSLTYQIKQFQDIIKSESWEETYFDEEDKFATKILDEGLNELRDELMKQSKNLTNVERLNEEKAILMKKIKFEIEEGKIQKEILPPQNTVIENDPNSVLNRNLYNSNSTFVGGMKSAKIFPTNIKLEEKLNEKEEEIKELKKKLEKKRKKLMVIKEKNEMILQENNELDEKIKLETKLLDKKLNYAVKFHSKIENLNQKEPN